MRHPGFSCYEVDAKGFARLSQNIADVEVSSCASKRGFHRPECRPGGTRSRNGLRIERDSRSILRRILGTSVCVERPKRASLRERCRGLVYTDGVTLPRPNVNAGVPLVLSMAPVVREAKSSARRLLPRRPSDSRATSVAMCCGGFKAWQADVFLRTTREAE